MSCLRNIVQYLLIHLRINNHSVILFTLKICQNPPNDGQLVDGLSPNEHEHMEMSIIE